MNYKICKIKGTEDIFAKRIDKALQLLPDEWEVQLKDNKYSLYCAPSIQDAFNYIGLSQEEAPDWDAVTCTHPSLKFFVFTPKIEIHDIQKVVNHEISHGIVDCENLMANPALNELLIEDSSKFPNRSPNFENLWDLKNFLIRQLNRYQKNEIYADIIAWLQKGGGLWGSGYKNGSKQVDFLEINFPKTFDFIKNRKFDSFDTLDIPF